jgi:environmental stress-induced protein Ves
MTLIRFRDIPPSPWKNGLGQTWEIAVDATPIAQSPFRWRLSRACIAETCPFSAYPGVRRWLALASGGALEMRIDVQPPHTLERPGHWIAFDGGASVESVPLDGPVEDFNLMLADPAFDAEMLHRPLMGSMVLIPEAGTVTAFHLLDGQAQLQGSAPLKMGPADTLLIRGDLPDAKILRVYGSGDALIVRIFPRSSSCGAPEIT